uniref:ATP synthase F0 subunit 8 n=1 Tax=Thyonella gemmata TaxID=206685 RepID=UPI001D126347|nr:ATP synthase F0 subunit 8 [Thyonella gemmata]QZM06629.1 ATP synthase F0 subunit 8 [Thyonella gemmata]
MPQLDLSWFLINFLLAWFLILSIWVSINSQNWNNYFTNDSDSINNNEENNINNNWNW